LKNFFKLPARQTRNEKELGIMDFLRMAAAIDQIALILGLGGLAALAVLWLAISAIYWLAGKIGLP
jgi:hypothetical protein